MTDQSRTAMWDRFCDSLEWQLKQGEPVRQAIGYAAVQAGIRIFFSDRNDRSGRDRTDADAMEAK